MPLKKFAPNGISPHKQEMEGEVMGRILHGCVMFAYQNKYITKK